MKRDRFVFFMVVCSGRGRSCWITGILSAYAGEVLGVVSLDNNELDAVFQVLTGQRSLDRGDFFYLGEIARVSQYLRCHGLWDLWDSAHGGDCAP